MFMRSICDLMDCYTFLEWSYLKNSSCFKCGTWSNGQTPVNGADRVQLEERRLRQHVGIN